MGGLLLNYHDAKISAGGNVAVAAAGGRLSLVDFDCRGFLVKALPANGVNVVTVGGSNIVAAANLGIFLTGTDAAVWIPCTRAFDVWARDQAAVGGLVLGFIVFI